MIKITNLHKSFGKQQLFQDLNMQFEKGNITAVVGENGAGKTTLFRCIAGLESYEGQIEAHKQPLKNHLGFLLTNPYFLPKMTGLEYLRLVLHASNKTIKDLEQYNIFDLPLGQFAQNYSTGMQKKLAITALLLQDNDYFIFDEPFNGLDIQSNMLLTAIIQQLKARDKVIIIASHLFSGLEQLCDNMYLLQKNKPLLQAQKGDFEQLRDKMMQKSMDNKLKKIADL